MPSAWFLKKPSWTLFVLRELTSVFVGLFAVEMTCFVRAVAKGPAEYAKFLDAETCGGLIAFHLVGLVAVLYHTITWFVAAPKAMRLKIGEEPVPPAAVIGGHYAGFLVVSAAILWLFLGRS